LLTSRDQRFFAGVSSSAFCAFLTYTFLEPLFVPVGSNVAMVFLYILALNSALVGMSLGVLLPILIPGICFGGTLALLVGAFFSVSYVYYFPLAGGTLGLVFCVVSARYVAHLSINASVFTQLVCSQK
jgi:callose synthase